MKAENLKGNNIQAVIEYIILMERDRRSEELHRKKKTYSYKS